MGRTLRKRKPNAKAKPAKTQLNYLITGGAGFIGSNYVSRLLGRGEKVTVFDNLSRSGVGENLKWLRREYGESSFRFIREDIRDAAQVEKAVQDADVIVHLAAQTAATISIQNPREDFEINTTGTLHLLEASRRSGRKPIFLYASTNKVYGPMDDIPLKEEPSRLYYYDSNFRTSERQPLDFYSPYGCSKGASDQYVRDYSRIYDLPGIVMRQSCIFGPHQFGAEDQGWVAWFCIAALTGRPVTIYGNGKQVRDLLYVDDLLDAYDSAIHQPEQSVGQVFNLGGGATNSLSVYYEFFPLLEKRLGRKIKVHWGDWRSGDQKVFISDIRKAQELLRWKPRIKIGEGLKRLVDWIQANQEVFA